MTKRYHETAVPRAPSTVDRILAGDVRTIARCISAVENGDPAVASVMDELQIHAGRAIVVGITGVPGAGKSTLVSALARKMSASGKRPAILAVDPSSPISGGALLGDRIRDASDGTSIFFRSVATRGNLGGISRTLDEVVTVLDAAGRNPVIVETVGTGQSEIDIIHLAHTTLAITAPGLGDEVQAMKAGINEVADIHVVNKADLDARGASAAAMTLRQRLADSSRAAGLRQGVNPATGLRPAAWLAPVLTASAQSGAGLDEILAQVADHRAFLETSGGMEGWLLRRAEARLRAALRDTLYDRVRSQWAERIEQYVMAIARGQLGPARAAQRIAFEALSAPTTEGKHE